MDIKSISLAAITIILSTSLVAAPILYTDKTSFEAAVTIGQLVDFEANSPTGQQSMTYGDATFVSTDRSGIHRTTGFSNPTVRLAAQNGGGIRIDLAPGWTSIGLVSFVRYKKAY